MSIAEPETQTKQQPPRRGNRSPSLSPAAIVDQTGRVKWFDDEKGFGFITPDNPVNTGGREVFVHHSGILMDGRRTLTAGERVTFILDFNERGPIALAVARD